MYTTRVVTRGEGTNEHLTERVIVKGAGVKRQPLILRQYTLELTWGYSSHIRVPIQLIRTTGNCGGINCLYCFYFVKYE